VFQQGGFRHDAGPTVITAPFLFDELFSLFGEERRDAVEFVPLTPWYRFHFATGNTFDYGGTVEDTESQIRKISPADIAGYRALLTESRKRFEIGFSQLADEPFHSIGSMVRQIPNLARLRADRSVYDLVARHIKHDDLRQAFSMQPLLVGGNPFHTSSIYNLIHYLERKWGVFFAMGGTGAIVDALEQLMLKAGIEIELTCTVDHLSLQNRVVTGAVLKGGRQIKSDLVVSNVDPNYLFRHMVPRKDQRPSLRLKRRFTQLSMGLFVLFFGSTRKYPDVAHHTIWLGPRYKELLQDIFQKKTLAEDFSLYIHRPTATDPTFAPGGMDSFYVLAPVPNLTADIDWGLEAPRLKSRILSALDKNLLPGIYQNAVETFWMTPEDFSRDYLSEAGAGFAGSPTLQQSAWFRFHNQAEGLRNLYLTGAGTHPGAGIPGVLCSAKVIEKLIPTYKHIQTLDEAA
tara:strand:- start:1892 stop:3268 length:1377 start_codon:yes stop_codon:yes gene_type:complete